MQASSLGTTSSRPWCSRPCGFSRSASSNIRLFAVVFVIFLSYSTAFSMRKVRKRRKFTVWPAQLPGFLDFPGAWAYAALTRRAAFRRLTSVRFRTGTETDFPLTTFSDLGLSQKVLSAVTDAGYTIPTPIQAGAIPPALQRRDILGIAQTGTGKTASFVLPMLTLLEKGRARARMPRTLILEPRANWPHRWPRTSKSTARITSSTSRC